MRTICRHSHRPGCDNILMNLLAIESATESCSLALMCGENMLERHHLASRRYSERVLPMLDALLAEAGLVRQALDVIAVDRGPGAFTGVRLAVSLAQGMALALDRPVVTVSSLHALALEANDDAAAVLAVMDARMGEIYAASYRRHESGALVTLDEECICRAEDLLLSPMPMWQVVGSGWVTYANTLRARLTGTLGSADGERYPQARHVATLAACAFRAGHALAAHSVLPVYLRDKVALTLRERGKLS